MKESAQKNSKPDEEKGDDTPIEVVDEDGLNDEPVGKEEDSQQSQSSEDTDSNENPFTSSSSSDVDMGGVEQRLDKIIEQNEKMIEILKSFGS